MPTLTSTQAHCIRGRLRSILPSRFCGRSLGSLGVRDADFLTAGATAALNYGQDRDAFLAPHLQAVHAHAHTI
jgi:hypothetical protein